MKHALGHVSAASLKTGGYFYFCEAKMQIKSLSLRQKDHPFGWSFSLLIYSSKFEGS
jgi:hypothetical protein